MIFHNDKDFMALMGLPSPFIAADPLYSPITERSIMTHRIFPGLSGFVPCGEQMVAGLFVDQLPEDAALKAILMLTTRRDAAGDDQECWLIQVESYGNAWQFMTIDETLPMPDPTLVLFQWKPGALAEAYAMHDQMIADLGDLSEFWLVGSDLEKEAYSRFVLSSGASSFAHPYQANGLMAQALATPGVTLPLSQGPCSAMKAYPVKWYQVE
jgi:hypothetical protein